MNMSRICNCSEKSCRIHFGLPFYFFTFSSLLSGECCSGHRIIAGDCSCIPKSGKMTQNIGNFWNGCASKAEKVPEISLLAVADAEHDTAMHPEYLHTPAVLKDEETRMDFCLRQAAEKKDELRHHAGYIVNDGAYAKKKYADGIVNRTDPHLISKPGKYADLRYLCTGPRKGGKGRPKIFDGKTGCENTGRSRFVLCHEDGETAVYSAAVSSRALKRNIRAAYAENRRIRHPYFQRIRNRTDI